MLVLLLTAALPATAPAPSIVPRWLAPPPAAAAVLPSTVSYNPAIATPTLLQTFEIIGNADAPGGDGSYQLSDGTHTTAPINYRADLPTFVAALESAGFVVASASGGTGAVLWPGAVRWNITFGVDPGVLLTVSNIKFARTFLGSYLVGVLNVDCVYCLDVYPPTGPSNGAAIVVVHPGALTTGSKEWPGLNEVVDPYRAAGYTAAVINHRLASAPPGGGASCEIDTVFAAGSPCDLYVKTADDAGADLQLATQWLFDHAASFALTPGKVGAIGVSSGGTVVAHSLYVPPTPGHRKPLAGASVGGALRDTAMVAGAPPLLVGAFTADPAIVYTGTDTYQEAQEAIGRARIVGDRVEARVWMGPGHVPELHTGTFLGTRDTSPEYNDMVSTSLAFFATNVLGTSPPGPTAQWYGSGPPSSFTRPAAAESLFRRPTENVRAIRGDFDGNGLTDLFWYGTGAYYDTLWLARADGTFADAIEVVSPVTGALGYYPIVQQDGSFDDVVVGDFDGNGKDDVLFALAGGGTGSARVWRFGTTTSASPVASVPTGAIDVGARPVIGDIDADGLDDILWYATGATPSVVWYGDPSGSFVDAGAVPIASPPVGAAPKVADFDGDGHTDVVWSTTGATAERVWWGGTRADPFASTAVSAPGTSWDTGNANHVVTGDVDGDGRADLLVVGNGLTADAVIHGTADRAGSRQPFVWLGSATPIVADYDGDGRADVYWSAPTSAIATLWLAGPSGFSSTTTVGRPGTPLAGTFNGFPATIGRARADVFWI
jgi:hypothetical protein